MDDYIVTNMPIKPRAKTKTGMLTTPLIIEICGKIFNAKTCLNFNMLNSYLDLTNELKIFKTDLDYHGYHFDKEDLDSNWLKQINSLLNFMVKNHFIKQQKLQILHCSCGRVEILKSQIKFLPNLKLITRKGTDYFCNICHDKLICTTDDCLTLKLSEDVDDSIKIVPTRYANITKHFSKEFKGKSILVSKKRNTGCEFIYNGNKYYIDVDFILLLTPQLFKQKNIIFVNNEKHQYHVYLSNYINNIMATKNLLFIASPYIHDYKNEMDNILTNRNNYVKKLAILFNMNWNEADSIWKDEIYKKLCNYDTNKILDIFNNLHKIICYNNQSLKSLEHCFIKLSNMSENIKAYKQRKNNKLV